VPAANPGSTMRPRKLLIAALGGEGGGVLTNWIVGAAAKAGFPVQSTSIPGVAQRTGATTYYIEIFPKKIAALDGKRPMLALTPGVGDVDIAVASELLEAGRTVANGFITPECTQVIASTSRLYTMDEKTTMGDGRFDNERLVKAVTDNAREALLIDMGELARQSNSVVNAVMLGAIAGCGCLPLAPEQLEVAIRNDGIAVEGNLRGFRAGLAAARAKAPPAMSVEHKHRVPTTPDLLEHEVSYSLPVLAQPVAVEGIRRLIAYQSVSYARLYLNRLRALTNLDEAGGMHGRLMQEVARQLAVRMSYEDVVRVAEAKIAPERMRRIAHEELRVTNEPFSVHDFLKPGIEELCQLLPGPLARPILWLAARHGWLGRVHFAMEVETTSITGFLRFMCLAKLKRLRPHGHRYAQEQRRIEAWLDLVAQAARKSGPLALEVAECARLLKGYGDTYARGIANFATIEARVIRPTFAGDIPLARAVDAVASARTAALVDPDGESLTRCLAELDRSTFQVAAE
jgi:indolepyruvate ferredoxin oxidoreductase beta subunit